MINDAIGEMAPLVRRFEGLAKLKPDGLVYPYTCPAGYPTQGYGILVESLASPPITPEEAERRMRSILPGYIMETLKICPRLWSAPPEVLAAVADFTYNLGAGNLKASTLRKRIAKGDWEAAIVELNKWVFGGGKKLPGLVIRRAVEGMLVARATRRSPDAVWSETVPSPQ